MERPLARPRFRQRCGRVLVLTLAACADSGGPSENASFARFTADAAGAVTTPVVSDLFRMAAYVADGLASGARGCLWHFDVPSLSYQPMACGLEQDLLLTYVVSQPDLPHRGSALPLEIPLSPSGEMRFPAEECRSGFDLGDEIARVLTVCPKSSGGAGIGWRSALRPGGAEVWEADGLVSSVTTPSPRNRHQLTLQAPGGGSVTLEHDEFVGIERSESRLRVSQGSQVLELDGFAGSEGPEYAARRNGSSMGTIRWAGAAGFVTEDPHGAPLPDAESRLLLDARLLLAALSRIGSGSVLLLSQIGSDP